MTQTKTALWRLGPFRPHHAAAATATLVLVACVAYYGVACFKIPWAGDLYR
jgi:hypothetical protein